MFDPSKYTLAPNKSGVWEIRWSEDRGDRIVSRSHSTRERARSAAEKYRRHWLAARQEALSHAQGTPPLSDLLDRYELSVKARGIGATQLQILARLRAFFGDMTPAEVDEDVILAYGQHRGISPGSLRRELNALVAVMNFGVRKKLVPAAEVPHVDLPPEGQRREVFLSASEEKAFMATLAREPMARYSRFALIALRTGARRAAIEGLTWDRVDLDGRFIDFRDTAIRRTKKRRVPVPVDDVLLPVLRAAQTFATDEYVIGKGPIRADMQRHRKNFPEFEHVTPHVLRHTAATRWLRDGLSIWEVAGLLGDTVETTTKVYGHHATGDLRVAMSRGMK